MGGWGACPTLAKRDDWTTGCVVALTFSTVMLLALTPELENGIGDEEQQGCHGHKDKRTHVRHGATST